MRKYKRGKKMVIIVSIIIGIIVLTFVAILLYYNKGFPEVLDIAEEMEHKDHAYYFDGDSDVGFMIFSGAKSDERAYAYMAKLLNDQGYTVIIPEMPFHMSIFGTNRGIELMNSNLQIQKWYLIGHSLGGYPVSHMAAQNLEHLEGIAFLASYMISDLSDIDVAAIRFTASNDQIMQEDKMEENLEYLPSNSISVELEGANHKGFGACDALSKDGIAKMSWKEQQEQTVKIMLDFFRQETGLEGE